MSMFSVRGPFKPIIYHPFKDAPEEIFRASGQSICETCGKEYFDHQHHAYTDDPAHDQAPLMLIERCDHRLFKL